MSLSYLIHELDKIEGSEDLIIRLNKGEDSAYSEALLATYFSKMGFEIHLEPVIETGRRNDIAVKVNSEWINIEVKTPQRSDLQKEIEKTLEELFHSLHKIALSRDLHIFLTREPTYEQQKAIAKKTLELALHEQQPAFGEVKDISYIRTENLSTKPILTGTRMIGRLIVSPPYPNLVRLVYEKMPVLFLSGAKFDTSENGVNVNFTIHIPFEDERVISMINQKRKQLSQDSMNMVALDTTHIPISPNARKHYRWITRLKEALKTKLSRRIGAVLLFSRLAYRDKTSLRSSLFIHPNPYKRLPLSFLDKCDLNSYELPNI